jgi:predicted permease
MANAAFNLLVFTVGIRLFTANSGEKGTAVPAWRMIALNPALLATLAGFICFVTGFRLPSPVHTCAEMLGGMTSPISMLLVGSILAKSRLRTLFTDIRTLPIIALRLGLIPLAAFFVLRPFITNDMMLGVIVVLAAMPVAAITVIFAEQYKGDTARASRLVALSTVVCVATLPLISMLLF